MTFASPSPSLKMFPEITGVNSPISTVKSFASIPNEIVSVVLLSVFTFESVSLFPLASLGLTKYPRSGSNFTW